MQTVRSIIILKNIFSGLGRKGKMKYNDKVMRLFPREHNSTSEAEAGELVFCSLFFQGESMHEWGQWPHQTRTCWCLDLDLLDSQTVRSACDLSHIFCGDVLQ